MAQTKTRHDALSLNVFNSPYDGDLICFPSGQHYTLRQDMNPTGWTLYDGKMPHYLIQRIPSMVELIRAITEAAEHEKHCTGAMCECRSFTSQVY